MTMNFFTKLTVVTMSALSVFSCADGNDAPLYKDASKPVEKRVEDCFQG